MAEQYDLFLVASKGRKSTKIAATQATSGKLWCIGFGFFTNDDRTGFEVESAALLEKFQGVPVLLPLQEVEE